MFSKTLCAFFIFKKNFVKFSHIFWYFLYFFIFLTFLECFRNLQKNHKRNENTYKYRGKFYKNPRKLHNIPNVLKVCSEIWKILSFNAIKNNFKKLSFFQTLVFTTQSDKTRRSCKDG